MEVESSKETLKSYIWILNKLEFKAALDCLELIEMRGPLKTGLGPFLTEWAAQTYTSKRIKNPSDQVALLLLSLTTYIHFGPAVHAWVCSGSLMLLEFGYHIHVDFSPEKAFRVHHFSTHRRLRRTALISWRIFCFLCRDFPLGLPW